MDIVGQLTSQLGLEPAKAEAGMGVLLNAIKDKAPAGDLQGLLAGLPDSSAWMSKASALATAGPAGGGLASLGGALGGGLAGMAGQAAGVAQVVSLLGKLGIDAGTAAKFVPLALQLLKSKAGAGSMDKLADSVPFVKEALGGGGLAGGLGGMLGKLGQ